MCKNTKKIIRLRPAEIEHKLNADLSHVNDSLKANKLTLNTSKTEFLLIASKGKLS